MLLQKAKSDKIKIVIKMLTFGLMSMVMVTRKIEKSIITSDRKLNCRLFFRQIS